LPQETCTDAEIVRFDALWRFAIRQLADSELPEQGLDDASDDLVLHREDVGEITIEPLGPEMAAAFLRVDQLGVDADARRRASRTALQDIADAEFPSDPADIDRLVLEGEAGVAGDDEEPGRLG